MYGLGFYWVFKREFQKFKISQEQIIGTWFVWLLSFTIDKLMNILLQFEIQFRNYVNNNI